MTRDLGEARYCQESGVVIDRYSQANQDRDRDRGRGRCIVQFAAGRALVSRTTAGRKSSICGGIPCGKYAPCSLLREGTYLWFAFVSKGSTGCSNMMN